MVINRCHQKPLVVTTVYIPPNSNLSEAINHIENVAVNLSPTKPDWVLCGDFNVDLSPSSSNNNSRKLLNFAARNQLIQLINSPTRSTISSRTIIDHIYVNLPHSYTTSGVIKYGVSDHDLVFTSIKKPTYSIPKENFTCRTRKCYSVELLNYHISITNWSEFDSCVDVDLSWSTLYNAYV